MTSLITPTAHTTAKHPFNPNQKVRDAVKSAKQRCTNPNNKDYKNYGAKGIKCLITSDDVVKAIGLPKSADLSLDRKDPHGHYEIGNIGWTNKFIQAVNKKALAGTSSFVLNKLLITQSVEVQKQRSDIARCWGVGIKSHNCRCISNADKHFVDTLPFLADPLEASFALDAPKDFAQSVDHTLIGTFHFPSLTRPGERVSVRGGAWQHPGEEAAEEATMCGIIHGMRFIDLALNMETAQQDAIRAVLEATAAVGGIVFVGQPMTSSSFLLERGMLAVASRMNRRRRRVAAMFPVMTILALMDEAEPHWISGLEKHPVLGAEALFVPDLQVDAGIGWTPNAYEAGQLRKLFQLRRKEGHRTFVGVQNMAKLPHGLAIYLSMPGNFSQFFLGMPGA